jgi:hypothetical protein
MQKWEYKIEPGIVGGSVLAELNKRGNDGWELAAVAENPKPIGGNTVVYIFKRPKS